MANSSTPYILEDDEHVLPNFSPHPHTTASSSSSLSTPTVLNLPPHMTTSSTSSSTSSITTPFLDLPLQLVLTLHDRKIYTDDVDAYEYWVNNEAAFSDWAYSFFIVVHHFLLDIYVQHTIHIDLEYGNHRVNVLYYNNTNPIGISINTFIDDDTDDISIGSASYVYDPNDFINDGFSTGNRSPPTPLTIPPTSTPPTYDNPLLDHSYVNDPNDFTIWV